MSVALPLDANSIVIGVILGVLLGTLVTTSLIYPRIARLFGKIIASALIGIGAGLLVWGLYTVISGEQLRRMSFGLIMFSSIGQILGWGGGTLASGIVALVLCFVGRSR